MKVRECTGCAKELDAMIKDSKRKKQFEMYKEWAKTATDDQRRRMLFVWGRSKVKMAGLQKNKNLFPWAHVMRQWKITKSMEEGVGGVMKTYFSFMKWYTEQKGWDPKDAHKHWQKRMDDTKWRKGVDEEDPAT